MWAWSIFTILPHRAECELSYWCLTLSVKLWRVKMVFPGQQKSIHLHYFDDLSSCEASVSAADTTDTHYHKLPEPPKTTWRVRGDLLQTRLHGPQLMNHKPGNFHHKSRFVNWFISIPVSLTLLEDPMNITWKSSQRSINWLNSVLDTSIIWSNPQPKFKLEWICEISLPKNCAKVL